MFHDYSGTKHCPDCREERADKYYTRETMVQAEAEIRVGMAEIVGCIYEQNIAPLKTTWLTNEER